MKESITNFLAVGIFLGMIVVGPLISIWAINTLFPISIPYTFSTWLAMLWVGVVIFPSKGGK